MQAIRDVRRRKPLLLFVVTTICMIALGITLSLRDTLYWNAHTIGTVVDAQDNTWYARDNRTLFRTDQINTHIVYQGRDGLRDEYFFAFNLTPDDEAATPLQ